jgi:hypothetical protein
MRKWQILVEGYSVKYLSGFPQNSQDHQKQGSQERWSHPTGS